MSIETKVRRVVISDNDYEFIGSYSVSSVLSLCFHYLLSHEADEVHTCSTPPGQHPTMDSTRYTYFSHPLKKAY